MRPILFKEITDARMSIKTKYLFYLNFVNYRSPRLLASAVVYAETLDELGQCFFGSKYSESLKTALQSHGFAPIPVYSNILIEIDELMSNFSVVKLRDCKVEVRLVMEW